MRNNVINYLSLVFLMCPQALQTILLFSSFVSGLKQLLHLTNWLKYFSKIVFKKAGFAFVNKLKNPLSKIFPLTPTSFKMYFDKCSESLSKVFKISLKFVIVVIDFIIFPFTFGISNLFFSNTVSGNSS